VTEYLLGVFGTVAVIGIASLFAYDGGDTALKFALAVLLVYSVTVPAYEVIQKSDFTIPDLEQGALGSDADYLRVAEEAFREGVRSAVAAEFSLSRENIRVLSEDFDFESMSAGRVRIMLSGKAILADYKKIEDYIERLGLGECEVEIEI